MKITRLPKGQRGKIKRRHLRFPRQTKKLRVVDEVGNSKKRRLQTEVLFSIRGL